MNQKYLETIISMIKNGKEKESKYHYFYKYFCAALKNLKIQLMIDNIIITRLDLRKKFTLEELNDKNIDYSLPEYLTEEEKQIERKNIKRIIDKIRKNSFDEYETIKGLEKEEEIKKLENRIYRRVIEELENISTVKLENTNIKQECIRNLEGISINGEQLIVAGKINEKVYNQILAILDSNTISEVGILAKLKIEKMKTYHEIQQKLNQIENLSQILETLTREVIEQELEEIDKYLLKIILKDEYIEEHAKLLLNEHFEEHAVCIGATMPDYIKLFPNELRKPIEYRCRLQGILNSISSKGNNNSEVLKFLSQEEKKELKSRIGIFLKETNEAKLDRYLKALRDSIEDYVNKKREYIVKQENKIDEIIEPTIEAIRTKKTDKLKPLYDNIDTGLISPLESIFIYKLLLEIENMENIDCYKDLVYVLLSDEIQILDMETIINITSIINDEFDEYFYEEKKNRSTIDNKK